MRKSRNTKLKSDVKKTCLRMSGSHSALEKTYSRKTSCFSKSGLCFSRTRVCSFLGGVCFVGLLLIAFLAVAPLVGSVYAEEDINTANDTTNDVADADAGIAAQEATISSVTFSFGDPVGVADLTPVSSNGASAKYSVQATVSVENSGGYAVYLGSNKSELVGKNTGVAINSVTSSSTYEGLPLNSWGYNAVEGETAGNNFSAIPTNNRGDIIGENTSNNIKSDEKTFTLSFATHIGNDKPADTYENEVTMSVVSSPLEITNAFGIETMQEMTSAVCGGVEVGTTDRLRDARDNKMYWVRKMPDNQCWMVQNLDLNITAAGLSAATSDITSDWNSSSTYKPVNYETSMSSATIDNNHQGTRSWEQGMYVIVQPTASDNCGATKPNIAACPSQFVNVLGWTAADDPEFYSKNGNSPIDSANKIYDAHYLIGNHYQWNAATAGTGGTITSGQAAGSICPKGWKLPTSNSTASGSFAGLISAGSIGTDVVKFTSEPFYFVRGGLVWQNTEIFGRAGDSGFYWSSTPNSNGNDAYFLRFDSTNSINPSYYLYYGRSFGFSVRCLAN